MEAEGSLACSQEPVTISYPDYNTSAIHALVFCFLKIHCNIILHLDLKLLYVFALTCIFRVLYVLRAPQCGLSKFFGRLSQWVSLQIPYILVLQDPSSFCTGPKIFLSKIRDQVNFFKQI
jgi:hypothetical protein